MKCAILALALVCALMMMAGCGSEDAIRRIVDQGGDGNGNGQDDRPIDRPTPSVSSIFPRNANMNIRVNHLELTDRLLIAAPGYHNFRGPAGFSWDKTNRILVACSGGNRCTATQEEADGELVRVHPPGFEVDADFSVDPHQIDVFADAFGSYALNHLIPDTDKVINGWHLYEGKNPAAEGYTPDRFYAGTRDHSIFYTYSVESRDQSFWQVQGAAMGDVYSGRPPAGSATWQGAMTGVELATGVLVDGASQLDYNFESSRLDLALNVLTTKNPADTYTGPDSFVWTGLRTNTDGSFYIPGYDNKSEYGSGLHQTLGYVDGDFYGPDAEEFAGVFERDGVMGAFGGNR